MTRDNVLRDAGNLFKLLLQFQKTHLSPIGVMERYHVKLSQLGFDSCVVVTAEYHSENATLTKETVYPALCCMIQEHCALAAQIRTGDKSDLPKFIRLSKVNLDTAVEFRNDDGVPTDELLRQELERKFEFDVPSPLWYLTIIDGRTIIFAYHHVIADGQSGPALLHAFLCALNAPSKDIGVLESIISIPIDSTIVGPTEAYTNITPSISELFHTLYKMVVPSSWTEAPYAWTGNPVPRTPSLAMTVRCWEISATHTSQLLELCRENQTTLTAFLYTLVVGVLSRLVNSGRTKQQDPYRTISTVVAVSLRRFTGASPLVLCDQVCSTQSYVPLHDVERDKGGIVYFPWAVAGQFGLRIQTAIKRSRETLGMLRLLFWLGMADSYFLGMLGKKRETGLTISNLGRFPLPNDIKDTGEPSWTLKHAYFAQCDVVRGAAIKMNVMGSPSGTTNITFTWGQHSIDEDLAEGLIKEVQDLLSAILA